LAFHEGGNLQEQERYVTDRRSALDASATPVPNGGFTAFEDNRDVSFAAGMLEHLGQLGTIRLDIEVGCFVAVG
jgi:hypothetical protein